MSGLGYDGKGVKGKVPAFHGDTKFEFVEAVVDGVCVVDVVVSGVVEVAESEVWGGFRERVLWTGDHQGLSDRWWQDDGRK